MATSSSTANGANGARGVVPLLRRLSVSLTLLGVGALVGACSFGLGEYTASSGRSVSKGTAADAATEDAATGGEPDAEDPEQPTPDAADGSPPLPVDGGECALNASETCPVPNVADAAISCIGERRCVQGVWSPCKAQLRCPAAWSGPALGPLCQNLDIHGDSDRWSDSPTVGPPVTLWGLTRKVPFELYGIEDSFCFRPSDAGNCYTTTTTAVSVECTGGNLKLSGNDFLDGRIHNKEFCIKNAGASCVVLDVHGGGGHWQPAGATTCTRWFRGAHWRAQAEQRCSW